MVFLLLTSLLNSSTTIMCTCGTLLICRFKTKQLPPLHYTSTARLLHKKAKESDASHVKSWWLIKHRLKFASWLHCKENSSGNHVTTELHKTKLGRWQLLKVRTVFGFVLPAATILFKYSYIRAVTVLLLSVQEIPHSKLGYPTGYPHRLTHWLAWIKVLVLFLDYHQKMLQ